VRRKSSSAASAPAAAGQNNSYKVVRTSYLDTATRLPAVDFPMQFNFGSAYGASVNIVFDQTD
jgi:hypothetical protein